MTSTATIVAKARLSVYNLSAGEAALLMASYQVDNAVGLTHAEYDAIANHENALHSAFNRPQS